MKDFLAEALEWGAARETAKADRETDWALLCRTADCECKRGDTCSYALAAARFFDANKGTLSEIALAKALRAIIVSGPSKTTRTPLLVGPTNTGKTTLILPFDNLFTKKRVFHKPALGANYPLRNILKDKRFLLWDDFRPVDYAQSTIEVATLLSLLNGLPFEVQTSQAFNDGHEDFQWLRGAVATAKAKGLWDAYGEVSEEDIRHMQSRFEQFLCHATLPSLKDTDPCAVHMCRWIRDGAAKFDAQQVLQPCLPILGHSPPAPEGAPGSLQDAADATVLLGMSDLVGGARLPVALAASMEAEVLALGAVHVKEMTLDDWKSLASWSRLRPLEQRRLLAHLRLQ
jgi:hypothetical protein